MRNGFQVYDSDTHVNPAAEVLERYVDPGFRPRLAELTQYRHPVGQGAVGGVDGLHNYRVGTKYYRRVLGDRSLCPDYYQLYLRLQHRPDKIGKGRKRASLGN